MTAHRSQKHIILFIGISLGLQPTPKC